MCGSYYVDDGTAREIEKLVRQVDEGRQQGSLSFAALQAKDICPTEIAPVLAASNTGSHLCCRMQRWGFLGQFSGSGHAGKKLVFNARCETVTEKPMFSAAVANRRAVIPATWFYEWNHEKEKNIFSRRGGEVLFMAGFYDRYPDGEHFVILTTQANESMRPVHDRMPLVLEEEDIRPWILEPNRTMDFLGKKPCLLERKSPYEQLCLF